MMPSSLSTRQNGQLAAKQSSQLASAAASPRATLINCWITLLFVYVPMYVLLYGSRDKLLERQIERAVHWAFVEPTIQYSNGFRLRPSADFMAPSRTLANYVGKAHSMLMYENWMYWVVVVRVSIRAVLPQPLSLCLALASLLNT